MEAPENEAPDEDAPDFPDDLEAPADPEAANQAPEKEARKSKFGRKAMADAKKTGRKSDN